MMEMMIESTDQITTMDSVRVRVWEGTTRRGIKCKVFIHRIAVHNQEDAAEFEKELSEMLPPGVAASLRDVL